MAGIPRVFNQKASIQHRCNAQSFKFPNLCLSIAENPVYLFRKGFNTNRIWMHTVREIRKIRGATDVGAINHLTPYLQVSTSISPRLCCFWSGALPDDGTIPCSSRNMMHNNISITAQVFVYLEVQERGRIRSGIYTDPVMQPGSELASFISKLGKEDIKFRPASGKTQPLIAPAIPLTKVFWRKRNKIKMGSNDRVAAAHNTVQSVAFSPTKAYIPTARVRKSGRPKVKTRGMKKLFQLSISSKSVTVPIIGSANGTATCQYTIGKLAPSNAATSSNSFGKVTK